MPKLSDVLKTRYTAWRTDVPATWQPPLQGVEPDFAGVPTTTTLGASIAIFPRLKSDPLTCHIPVVFLTSDDDMADKALKARAVAHLRKPVTAERMVNVVRRFIAKIAVSPR